MWISAICPLKYNFGPTGANVLLSENSNTSNLEPSKSYIQYRDRFIIKLSQDSFYSGSIEDVPDGG
jgi:hypothetical protein